MNKDIGAYAHDIVRQLFPYRLEDILDSATLHHSERVSSISTLLAQHLGYHTLDTVDIAIGALLHDIGKLQLDKHILEKAEALSDNERSLLTLHPILGYQLVKEIKCNNIIKDIVLKHHEKLDGSGYPSKLYGNNIPFEVQIVTVADIYAALTEERVYHKAKSTECALEILQTESGLNVVVVDALKDVIYKH